MFLYRTVTTAGFKRDVRRVARRNTALMVRLADAVVILENDPFNLSRRYNIVKLIGVKARQGQWRLRIGDYRIRYDVFGREVVLYTFRHRREAYE